MTVKKKYSILVVEDERIVALDLAQTLASLGYDAMAIASSADEAIAQASNKCPDLVLMDIRIKGKLDGIETARILKEKFGVPVIFLTAHADDATVERAKQISPHGYLLKPIKSEELRIAIEITFFKHQIEKRLQERERWFSTTLQSIADAVIAVDLSGKINFMNAAAEALVGVSLADAEGKTAAEILRLEGVDTEILTETPVDVALRLQKTVEMEEGKLKNQRTGIHHFIADSAAPVMEGERPLGAVMVFRDVTERKRLQKRVELSDRLASLGTMAAGVTQEINNPLSVVMGNAELLLESLLAHRQELEKRLPLPSLLSRVDGVEDMAKEIHIAASRIANVIAGLKAFSRPMVAAIPGQIDLAACVEWAMRTTAHEFQNRAKVTANLGPAPGVSGEEDKFAQVVVNLLLNAAHAIKPGNSGKNEVNLSLGTDSEGRAWLEIHDSGTGMPKDVLERLFEPFFTTKGIGQGTGLGLSICQGIVHALGGEISVSSQVGIGSVVRIVLPAAAAEQSQVDSSTQQSMSAGESCILVIDDEQSILTMVAHALQHHEVISLSTGSEALNLLDSGKHVDLILLDLMMPNMSGVEFYEALLLRHSDLASRIVFLAPGATNQDVEDFLKSVPNTVIEKPFNLKLFRKTIQKLL